MPPPLPILCNSCGYDITPLADRARRDPNLPCPECEAKMWRSLPERRHDPRDPPQSLLAHVCREYLDVYRRPFTIWQRIPLDHPAGVLSLLNVALTALLFLCSVPLLIWSQSNAYEAREWCFALLLWTPLTGVILLILADVVAHQLARLSWWRYTRRTLWTVLDRTTMLGPLGCTLTIVTMTILSAVEKAHRPSLVVPRYALFLTLAITPLLILIPTILALRALRYANPPPHSPPH